MKPLAAIPSLIDQVHLRLVEAIADGTLSPGQRVTQDEIAQSLSVSRQPVSHALQLLKRQGLVVEQGKRGLAVAPIDPTQMRDLYRVRGALDGLAAELAAERVAAGSAPAERIAALEACLAAGKALHQDTVMRKWIDADVAFHDAIYALADNEPLAETVAERWPHFKRGIGAALARPERRTVVWQEHVVIVRRLLAGDATGARRASMDHTERAGDAIFAALSARAA